MPQREVPRRGTDPLSLSPSLYPSLSHLENAPKQIVELLRKIELAKQQTKRSARVVIPEEEATLLHGCEGYLPCLSPFLPSFLSLPPSLTVPLKPNKFTLAECATRSLGSGNYPHAIEPAACY